VDLLRRLKAVEVYDESTDRVNVVDGYAFAKMRVERGLHNLEDHIRTATGGNAALYAAGTSTPTIADCLLIPQLAAFRRFKIDPSPYQHIMSVSNLCSNRQDFKVAAPQNQPDYDGK
jgi:glutathione S-transferase